jgi:hypothetical protein
MKFRRRAFAGRIVKIARLVCYAVVASIVCAALASRVVYADFTEGALRAGRELEGLTDVVGSPKTVSINGAPVMISTAFTDETPGEVLDRFEVLCREHPEFMARALSDLPKALLERGHVVPDRLWRLGVVRKERGDEGALTCFNDERPASFRDMMARLKAFERSKDLLEFGRFRYVYARRTDKGTHVRTIWTDGELKLDKMFPTAGDAAGFDSPWVPRPPNARRILSATSGQVPYALHIYRSSDSGDALHGFYDREMGAGGWTSATRDKGTFAYLKNGAITFVTLTSSGNATLVTTTETAGGDAATRADVHVETVTRPVP